MALKILLENKEKWFVKDDDSKSDDDDDSEDSDEEDDLDIEKYLKKQTKHPILVQTMLWINFYVIF